MTLQTSTCFSVKLHRCNRARGVFVSNVADNRWRFVLFQLLWLGMHNPCNVKEKQLSLSARGWDFRSSNYDTIGRYRWPKDILLGKGASWVGISQTQHVFSTMTHLLGKAFLNSSETWFCLEVQGGKGKGTCLFLPITFQSWNCPSRELFT